MTREEITKEAQKQVNYCTPLHPEDFIHGYIAGAEPREKRNEELEKDKAYAEEQLDKQVEATLQLQKEYNDLKETNAILSESAVINHKDIEYKISVIEQRNKKIAGLKQQIEEMKCCQNCKSEDNDYMEKPCCDCSRSLGDIKRKGTTDKWELEND
jgi:hypothetical protein